MRSALAAYPDVDNVEMPPCVRVVVGQINGNCLACRTRANRNGRPLPIINAVLKCLTVPVVLVSDFPRYSQFIPVPLE